MERPALQLLLEQVRQRRIDVIVVDKVDRLTRSLTGFAQLVELFDANGVSFVSATQAFDTTTIIGRLTLHVGRVVVHPWSATPSRRGRDIILPPGSTQPRPMKAEDRARILKAIAKGRAWMDELVTAKMQNPAAIASREILTERTVRMTLSLAHLAPSIVRAIIDGRLPRGLGIRDLADLPPIWTEQERVLGM